MAQGWTDAGLLGIMNGSVKFDEGNVKPGYNRLNHHDFYFKQIVKCDHNKKNNIWY